MLSAVAVILLLVLMVVYVLLAIRIVKEHEQGIVTRFGKFLAIHEAGLVLVVPFVDHMRKVDLRTLAIIERIDPETGEGKVQIWGESWPATTDDGSLLGPGTPIEVAGMDRRAIVVRPTL